MFTTYVVWVRLTPGLTGFGGRVLYLSPAQSQSDDRGKSDKVYTSSAYIFDMVVSFLFVHFPSIPPQDAL